ncbi:MAG: aldehyde dehydrogenase family protein [Bdellovibrionota bacterium]
MAFKITYSAVSADAVEIDKNFDAAVIKTKDILGKEYPATFGYKEISPEGYLENFNPADTRVLLSKHGKTPMGKFDEIMQLSHKAQKSWGMTSWQERAKILNKVANKIRDNRWEYSARMVLEVGKNRMEALGEVEESADLIDYYAGQLEKAEGFVQKMGQLSPGENALSVLKPYGVFAVIAPFNFPMALSAGMSAGALAAGNSVVMKIASTTPWTAQCLYEAYRDGGVPEGVLQLVQGSGSVIGDALANHPLTKGVVFTGSYDVGMGLIRKFGTGGKWVRPCFTEMGGKNPGIVCKSADLDKAVYATWKSGFGLSGQKCSELSRVYVHKDLRKQFQEKLMTAINSFVVGDPTRKEVFVGPVIDERAVKKYLWAVEEAKKNGGKILVGGTDLREKAEYKYGHFVAPTLVDVPDHHRLHTEELFLPFVNIYSFESIEEVIPRANDTIYGLTAGIFSRDERELEYFFNNIEAGVTYANRPTGITTGAWPGVNSFCGWKGSGGSGKGFCGPYYVSQFMREQSQTRHPYI